MTSSRIVSDFMTVHSIISSLVENGAHVVSARNAATELASIDERALFRTLLM